MANFVHSCHHVAPSRSHQPSEQDQNRLFQVLDLHWRAPESGAVWFNSRRLKQPICSPSPQATLLDIATFVHSCHHVVGSAYRPEVPEAGSSSRSEAGPSRSEAGPAAAIRGGGIPTGVIMSGSSVQVQGYLAHKKSLTPLGPA